MDSEQLSKLFEESISYDDIDKNVYIEKYDFNNKDINQKLLLVNIFDRNELFYYDKCSFIPLKI